MILLDLFVAHLVGDFILQTDRQARLKFSVWQQRALHVSTYCIPFVIVATLHASSLTLAALFLALLWLSHYIIDARRWWASQPVWLQIVRDQTLHVAALAVLVRFL